MIPPNKLNSRDLQDHPVNKRHKIMLEDVRRMLCSCKLGKAPGPDKVSNTLLKLCSSELIKSK